MLLKNIKKVVFFDILRIVYLDGYSYITLMLSIIYRVENVDKSYD